MAPSRVSQLGSTSGGGQFGQNGQKQHENYKIGIFGSKKWGGGGWGTSQFFWYWGEIPPSPPPTRGNPAQAPQKYPHHQKQLYGCTSMCEHDIKTTPVFLPADGEASWSLLPNSVSLLSGDSVQPENTYPRILKVTGQVSESQKRISINTNHSYHQRSSP